MLGLPVGMYLNIRPFCVVDRHQQLGPQHQGLSSDHNKVVILPFTTCAAEKRIFSVKEPPLSFFSSRRQFLREIFL